MSENNDTSKSRTPLSNIVLFNLGFRPFFLGAGIFSIISMSLWSLIYLFGISPPIEVISESQWHAHEMIFGYALAIIAGFLLTAVKNWTGIQTIHGKPLMLLFGLWICARLSFLFGTKFLIISGIFDFSFSLALLISVSYPIIKARQWGKQLLILSKVTLISTFNALFYLGALDILDDGVSLGLYGGLYLIIALILTIGRRVLPFFIEKGVGYEVKLFNSKWLDISSLLLFLGFFISEIFLENQVLSSYLALCLFLINGARLIGWHTVGIWKKSLLWSVYLSFCFICIGFLMFAGIHFAGISKLLAIHAFGVGGIGVITISMMSRISLGHTGRGVNNPHKALSYAFGAIILSAIVRVILPLFELFDYEILIAISQLLWIASFLIFVIIYFPIVSKPRVDGKFG